MATGENQQVLGLADDQFLPRSPGSGVITKREVRAIALAQLALCAGSIVWDVGAGSGSVAIEAGRLASIGQVYAVECDEGALAVLATNRARHKAENVTVVAGRAPAALDRLPDPDAVFVGGSGGALEAIVRATLRRLRPEGRLVINVVALEHLALAAETIRQVGWGVECTLVNIARSRGILDVTRLAALNPVFIVTASWPPNDQGTTR